MFDNNWREEVITFNNRNKNKLFPSPRKDVTENITVKEIEDHITSLNTRKACGEDKTNNKIIKYLKPSLSIILHHIYNYSFKHGYIPDIWKSAIVSMIPKPGKDRFKAENYRPISLISSL